MADISRQSGFGAGQLYRCFNSKERLVHETIKNILQQWCQFLYKLLSTEINVADIIDSRSGFWKEWSTQDRSLLLEVYSEASRNNAVRERLIQEEEILIQRLDPVFQDKMPESDFQYRSHRINLLLMMIDGVVCRTFDDNDKDKNELARLTSILTQHLSG